MITRRLLAFLLAFSTAHADWPSWRGPQHDGSSEEKGLPMKWSDTENVAWKVALPGPGNSTPIIHGDQVILTQSTDNGHQRFTMAFDRKTGRPLWKTGVTWKEDEPTHKTNPHCSASPTTDGERIIVSYASAGIFCYDMQGKELWKRDLGLQHHIWGNGASPVIVGDRVFINHGPSIGKTKLVAMDKKTGEILWEQREKERPTKGNPGFYGSWSDPLPRVIDGKSQLLMSWPFRVCSIDPENGKDLWTCEGLNSLVYTSPLFADGVAVAMGGYSGMVLAVRAGGSGDVTSSQRIWHNPKSPQRIASGVIHEGHIYIHNDPGTAQCIDLKTGEDVWSERLKGEGTSGQNWSSVVLSEGKCYTVNQGGDCFIFTASPDFKLLATNPLREKVIASIAVADQHLYIRGHQHLFCIGTK